MRANAISWLHLTDLHVGRRQHAAWPSMRAGLEDDVERLLKRLGPITLIVFSGDLVQSGTEEEFKHLDDELESLYRMLERFDCRPILFPVPGNHDLVRPKRSLPTVLALSQWQRNPELADRIFWDQDEGSEYRATIAHAFEPYVAWREGWRKRHPVPATYTERSGLLPGDFSATLNVADVSLGLVGINSAFLHLTAEVREGGIDIRPEQFNALCAGDPASWCDQHDFRLLVTHHPPSWLGREALLRYRDQIRTSDWISLHLCGHMHESLTELGKLNSYRAERTHQGAALFGFADDASPARIHGYCGFRYGDSEDGGTELVIMPRLATRTASGKYVFARDTRFELEDDDALREQIAKAPVRKSLDASQPSDGRLTALLSEWSAKIDEGLIVTMEGADLPFTDQIIEFKKSHPSPDDHRADADKALRRYVQGGTPSLLECYLIATRLRAAIEVDDPAPCRSRAFIYPIHQYLSGAIRREPVDRRATAIATLSRWLTSPDVYAIARDFAAFELGMCRADTALPELLTALGNPFETEDVRLYAAMAIGMLRARSALARLVELYSLGFTPERVRATIAHAVIFIQRTMKSAQG